jgi:chemotaxis protein MotB
MARQHVFALALGLSAISLTGCISTEKFNAMRMEKDQLAEQLGQAQADASSARSAEAAWKGQYDNLIRNGNDMQKMYGLQTQETAELRAQNAMLSGKLQDALNREPTVINLPAPLANELANLAAQEPQVLEFDQARGIIKFKSDVTFAAGSADVTPQAKEAIVKFARILNSSIAQNYDFLVEGHTDNIPVSNPATIKRGHIDNWHLSSHRAISVGKELLAQRIAGNRLGVVGYADQRPVASNATPASQAKNRRVEVRILPTTRTGSGANVTTATTETPTNTGTPRRPAAARPEFNKDTQTAIPLSPVYNK